MGHKLYRICIVFFLLPAILVAENSEDRKWATAKRDTLRIELVETGEISAVRSTTKLWCKSTLPHC